MKQGRKAQKFHVASQMDICHFRMPNWKQSNKNTKGRIVVRSDIVEDDSGSYAVFTEQGSSASQNDGRKRNGYHIQTARVSDGQAADAVSANTQVRMDDAPKFFFKTKSQIAMSRQLDSSTTTQMA